MSAPFGGRFRGRKVLVTGHTGFKGSWLALWLGALGADVVGVAGEPPSEPSHFAACGLANCLIDRRGDIRDYDDLVAIFKETRPEIVFHLAAQPIVRRAFEDPRETFETNVMGTVNLLEAARRCGSVATVLVATSDKVFRNGGWDWPYRETDPLGGHEPYGGSKACAEIVAEVYADTRFQRHASHPRDLRIAVARAGNVIGGGDWAADRLLPDIVRAIGRGEDVVVRYPDAVRPWQHVLDCLSGYLELAARLDADGEAFGGAWNFGPGDAEALPVAALVEHVLGRWPGHRSRLVVDPGPPGKEAHVLRVDSSKARRRLGWRSVWSTAEALDRTASWYRAHAEDAGGPMRDASLRQIGQYEEAARALSVGWAVR